MSKSINTYRTLAKPSEEILYKEKNSKFFGYAFCVSSEEEVKEELNKLKAIHNGAGHFCYAYQLGIDDIRYRANDDGEPNNSAGMPIYGQIQSFNVTNILVVIVRYFGGIKLGVGGLISAYRTSAQLVLDASKIITKTIKVHFEINFGYDRINTVMRILKEKQLNIESQYLELDCCVRISTSKKQALSIKKIFEGYDSIEIKRL